MSRPDGRGLRCPNPGCAGRLIFSIRRGQWFCQKCEEFYTRAQVRAVNSGRG